MEGLISFAEKHTRPPGPETESYLVSVVVASMLPDSLPTIFGSSIQNPSSMTCTLHLSLDSCIISISQAVTLIYLFFYPMRFTLTKLI